MKDTTFLAVTILTWLAPIIAAATDAAQSEISSVRQYRIGPSVGDEAAACVKCHAERVPGLVADWADSRHAHAGVTCLDCHQASAADTDASRKHLEYTQTRISPVVSPKDCSRCHPRQATEYARSKHANTLEIMWKVDPWLNDGLNSQIERATGCDQCHGSVIKTGPDGVIDDGAWPNVGVGRLNPDKSLGSCSSCHTRHKFSLAEARKPEACGQCHLGPDHPQVEIYDESKHGAIYHAEGHGWKWDSAPGTWTAGIDYRAPTCSVCHMSGVADVPTTHDATERLAWETQAPLTIRPEQFKPWPAKNRWHDEREKMKKICGACHSPRWTDGHFDRFDAAVENYNQVYYKPAREIIDDLYEKKLLSREKALDEKLEIDFYEFWHHEGRRARFGAAMMAPDYAWWHGFYELKKRYMEIEEQAGRLLKDSKPARIFDVRGASGATVKPGNN